VPPPGAGSGLIPAFWKPQELTTTVSVPRAGHDINYMRNGQASGCAGAMAYYTTGGEPPGQWAGRGAGKLGLSGQVDMDVIEQLFMKNLAPTGKVLAKPPKKDGGTADVAVARAVHAYRRAHPYASAVELDDVRAVRTCVLALSPPPDLLALAGEARPAARRASRRPAQASLASRNSGTSGKLAHTSGVMVVLPPIKRAVRCFDRPAAGWLIRRSRPTAPAR
jgi:TrwC relaxase